MRKKLNKADQYFIERHVETMTAEQISEVIELEYDAVSNYYDVAKVAAKNKKREESNGVSVLTTGDSQRIDDFSKQSVPQSRPDYIWRG
jgi:hypothetical protein